MDNSEEEEGRHRGEMRSEGIKGNEWRREIKQGQTVVRHDVLLCHIFERCEEIV